MDGIYLGKHKAGTLLKYVGGKQMVGGGGGVFFSGGGRICRITDSIGKSARASSPTLRWDGCV